MKTTIIALLLIVFAGCTANRNPSSPPATEPTSAPSNVLPVYFEQKGGRGIYIQGFDQHYFDPAGIRALKGQSLKMIFAIANGLDDDIFFKKDEYVAQVGSVETPTSYEGGGVVTDLDLVLTTANYKHIRGAFQFINKGSGIDDGFILATATLPDHSDGKAGDVDVAMVFTLNFCIGRTGKWYFLRPERHIHVHYE